MKLLNVMWQAGWVGSLPGVGVGGMDTWICMAESLHCSPETITTLLIGYTPMQKRKLKKVNYLGGLTYFSFFRTTGKLIAIIPRRDGDS